MGNCGERGVVTDKGEAALGGECWEWREKLAPMSSFSRAKVKSRDGGNLLRSAPTRELLPSRFVGPFKARLIAGFFYRANKLQVQSTRVSPHDHIKIPRGPAATG
jgi:hypothetical protein